MVEVAPAVLNCEYYVCHSNICRRFYRNTNENVKCILFTKMKTGMHVSGAVDVSELVCGLEMMDTCGIRLQSSFKPA